MSDRDDGDDQDLGETTDRNSVTELQAKRSEMGNNCFELWSWQVICLFALGAPHPRAMDGRSVDEFIDQVPKSLKTRNLGKDNQIDFILSLLRGSTLEEICLCTKGEIFSFLREAQHNCWVPFIVIPSWKVKISLNTCTHWPIFSTHPLNRSLTQHLMQSWQQENSLWRE